MTYKEAITAEMTRIALDPLARFVGYGMHRNGAMGTLIGVKPEQIVETPVAENLMTGIACGLSLNGFVPVLYFERADFLMNAADAIVNHIDKMKVISRGEFAPALIIRVTIGNRTKPLFTGETHTQDFAGAFAAMCPHMRIFRPTAPEEVMASYAEAAVSLLKRQSSFIFELKDLM
jgi:pyruvate/2-oxoglutarate/acetoin dehydrogenase E1 component